MGVIRVLLALAVVFAHSEVFPLTGNRFTGGLVAVECFFMISGFYMALILSESYSSLRAFYINRFLRLFPTYWFLVAASVLVCMALGQAPFFQKIVTSDLLQWDGKLFMLFASLFIFGTDFIVYLRPSPEGLRFTANFWDFPQIYQLHPIPQAWTLPLEMMFYAIAPFLVKSLPRLLALIVLALVVRYLVYTYVSHRDPWTYRFFPAEIGFFCAGSVAYHAYTAVKQFRATRWIGFMAFVVAVLCITNYDRLPVLIPNSPLFSGRQIEFYLMMLIALPFIFQFTRKSRLDSWLGALSYPIYLSHRFVIEWLGYLPHLPSDWEARWPGAQEYFIVLNTLAVSALINALIQSPIERRFKRKADTAPRRSAQDLTEAQLTPSKVAIPGQP